MVTPLMQTQSLCPICLRVLDASIVEEDTRAYLHKTCLVHGTFETVLWRGENTDA